MENQAEFSVKPAIEKQPFQDLPTQQFFAKWCEVNDSIEPKYVSRDEWNTLRQESRQEGGILSKDKNEDGKQALAVPKDLKLWEMVDVIEAVDKDTFEHNPEMKQDKRKELNDLGETFVNAGIYMAQRREGIDEGKDTADNTAKDFYRYGNALRTGDYGEQTSIADIADNAISPRQTEQIDAWFGVDKLAALKQQDSEQTRQEMLTQFFRVAEKAKDSEPHRKALEKVHKKYLERPINTPDHELQSTIFRRGAEKILSEMGKEGWRGAVKENFKEIGIDLEGQEKNLREVLDLPRLKTELTLIRKTGDKEKIGNKEREVAGKIQEAVAKIPYAYKAGEPAIEGSYPSWIAEHQERICVGATIIGGALLRDVEINYLVANTPDHSFTCLLTSDNKVVVQDFMNPNPEKNLKVEDGLSAKIIAYSNSSVKDSFVFDKYSLSRPERGEQIQILDNYGVVMMNSGDRELAMDFFKSSIAIDKNNAKAYEYLGDLYQEGKDLNAAIDMYKEVVEISPFDGPSYRNLSGTLFDIGKTEEAVNCILKGIKMDAKDKDNYVTLGIFMKQLNKPEEALAAYDKAVALDSDDPHLHQDRGALLNDLGRKEEALAAYDKAVALDPADPHLYLVRGTLLNDLGKKEEASEAFNKILKLKEDEEDSEVKIAKMELKILEMMQD